MSIGARPRHALPGHPVSVTMIDNLHWARQSPIAFAELRAMWLEYIRYRVRLNPGQSGPGQSDPGQSCLDLAQVAALKSLRHSPRCRGWRVLPAPGDPSLSILLIEWDPEADLVPFHGSDEFIALHAALTARVQVLEEADYRADARLLQRILGGPEPLFRLAEDIVVALMREPDLGWRFRSRDGSKRGRLGLWVLEVLGGPDLFSSSYPDAKLTEGPLAREWLDLEERAQLLEVAQNALPSSVEEEGRCVLGALRAHLPLFPLPLSQRAPSTLLLEDGASTAAPPPIAASSPDAPNDAEPASHQRVLGSEARHIGGLPHRATRRPPVAWRRTPRRAL